MNSYITKKKLLFPLFSKCKVKIERTYLASGTQVLMEVEFGPFPHLLIVPSTCCMKRDDGSRQGRQTGDPVLVL